MVGGKNFLHSKSIGKNLEQINFNQLSKLIH